MTIRIFIIAAVALGIVGQLPAQREGGRPASTEVRGTIKSIDAGSITITTGGGRETAPTEKTYKLANDIEIAIGGVGGFRGSPVAREGKLKDLAAGMAVSLSLTADKKSVDSILAEEPMMRGVLKAIDLKKRTLTVTGTAERGRGEQPAAEERTLTIAADVEVGIDDGRGRRFSIREGKIEELNEGAILTLRLSLDKARVHGIFAEGSTVTGIVKAIDAGKRSITLTTRPARGEDAGEERTFIVAKEAVIVLDNGKGRRLSVKEGKLDDVPVGASVGLKLAVDQSFVMMIRAEGPQVFGMLKSVDADKGTVTIAVPKNRTEFDETTYTLAKDASVTFDGNATKLGDIKISETGPMVQLRLAFDQKTVQSLSARQPGSR